MVMVNMRFECRCDEQGEKDKTTRRLIMNLQWIVLFLFIVLDFLIYCFTQKR